MASHETLVSTGREVIREAPQLYIDLDVEADGVPGYGSLLSIGAISPWGDTFYRELRPSSDRFLPASRAFAEAHGLERERLLEEGTDPAVAARDLQAWTIGLTEKYDKRRAVLTAFNASFDFPWVDLAMKEAGVTNPFGIAGFCIKSLAMALPHRYDWRQTAKGKLPAELVPPGDFTHNALEDAAYQQPIHFALAGKLALMNDYEFSPRQNAHQLWEAAMGSIDTAENGRQERLLGHTVLAPPEGSRQPEAIRLAGEYDGNWSDTYQSLTITPDGPAGYEYSMQTWNPPTPEEDVHEQYSGDAPETHDYLNRLANQLRQ